MHRTAAIATEPAVLLMDEPCSALDPIATRRIEELMHELKRRYTIAIVTHNLQQAKRVADMTAFLYVDTSNGGRTGYMVEYDGREDLRRAQPAVHSRLHRGRVRLRPGPPSTIAAAPTRPCFQDGYLAGR